MQVQPLTSEQIESQERLCGTYTRHETDGGRLQIATDQGIILIIEVYTDYIIRLRYLADGYVPADFSYAISDNHIGGYTSLDVDITDEAIVLTTPKLRCHIKKAGLGASFFNERGELLSEDDKGCSFKANATYGGHHVHMKKHIQRGEHFFGLGDKTGQFNLRDRRYELWGSDIYGFQMDSDPLYKSIPFFMGIHDERCYGIFFDNTFKSYFDFGSNRQKYLQYGAEGGEMNYYFIAGDDPIKIVQRYTQLTGTAALPPLWALGYHQCKWSYYPEAQVREVCDKMRELRIPCDAIYLDIDYMDGFRCFTWDTEKFPDPKRMVSELREQGFKTVVIIDPGIKIDPGYWVYDEGIEHDYFCRRADGPYMQGKVWPGECYFPDYTNPEVRAWWSDLFKGLISDVGIDGVWNDMNEPAIFEVESKTFPDDVRHDFDGHPCSHRKAHNVYGMQMTRASYEGVKKHAYPKRPFLITRSCYSGIQRYASVWTGDNMATWDHLRLANLQCLRLNVSGVGFCGSDIGGFIDHPSPQLYLRWIQMATFHPFMRTHSSGDHGEQEPWSFGTKTLDAVRTFIELRYQMLPHLYTAFYQYSEFGTPIMRPIALLNIHDRDTYYRQDEYLFGDHLLVCPMFSDHAGRYVYLPEGKWVDYWNQEVAQGGQEVHNECGMERIPLYIRAGAVLAMQPVMQYVGEQVVERLTLRAYYDDTRVESYLYEDRGDGYDYAQGHQSYKTFTTQGSAQGFDLWQHKSGGFETSYHTYEILLIALPKTPTKILVDDVEVSWTVVSEGIRIEAPVGFKHIEVS